MADNSGPATDSNGKPAKNRLRDMLTTAVGLVDRAANEETFLVVKSKDGATMTTKKDDGGDDQGGLRLPADAKQSLTDGIADTLEKLAAIAQQVQGCVVDESAECPPELASSIDEIADDLDELADEFAPKASPTEMKSKGSARKANKLAKAKGKPFPGAAPPFGAKDKDDASDDAGTVAKVTTVAEGSASSMGTPEGETVNRNGPPKDPPGEGGGADESNIQPRGTTDNPDVVMKSGRKMAKDRLDTLQKGQAMHKAAHALHGQAIEMHKAGADHLEKCMKSGGGLESLTKGHAMHKAAIGMNQDAHDMHTSGIGAVSSVLKEIGIPDDEPGFMQPPGSAPKTPPASGKPAPAEPQVSPSAAAPDTTSMAKSATKAEMLGLTQDVVKEALAEPLANLQRTLDNLQQVRKEMGDAAALGKMRELTGVPRSSPNEVPPTQSAKPKQSWPADMSADIKRRTAAAK